MDPTSVLLGALIASTKGFAIATLAFGIAWWRSRRRVRELEAGRPEQEELRQRLDRLESSLEYMAGALDRLGRGQDDLRHALPPGSERDLAPPAESRETTPR